MRLVLEIDPEFVSELVRHWLSTGIIQTNILRLVRNWTFGREKVMVEFGYYPKSWAVPSVLCCAGRHLVRRLCLAVQPRASCTLPEGILPVSTSHVGRPTLIATIREIRPF